MGLRGQRHLLTFRNLKASDQYQMQISSHNKAKLMSDLGSEESGFGGGSASRRVTVASLTPGRSHGAHQLGAERAATRVALRCVAAKVAGQWNVGCLRLLTGIDSLPTNKQDARL
jgi:hypothetical protein